MPLTLKIVHQFSKKNISTQFLYENITVKKSKLCLNQCILFLVIYKVQDNALDISVQKKPEKEANIVLIIVVLI